MNKRILLAAILLLITLSAVAQEFKPWEIREPYNTGELKVSDIHTLYWEESGNPEGIPVIVLHGGPGVGTSPGFRSFFDPDRYRIVLFDQRGSGKSTPFAETRENTTWDLVEDINKLRDHLGIDKPAVLWGVSWGTTLAIAYAEKYPQHTAGMILVSTFTGLDWEIDHIYHGGAGVNYPENFAWLMELAPEPNKKNIPEQYHKMIIGADEELSKKAAARIAAYEIVMIRTGTTREQAMHATESPVIFGFAKISTFYMMQRCFFEPGQLLDNADKIKDIPTWFAVGRTDPVTPPKAAWDLARKMNNARFEVVDGATHNDPGVFEKAREGAVWMADLLEKK